MTELLAPNGNPSNLTSEQYLLVRTPAFKEFFGDWEKLEMTKINDSGIDEVSLKRLEDGVSKVVDSNGEPLPVYHGTDNDFNTFDKSKIGLNHWQSKSDLYGGGFFFTDKKNKAFRGKVKQVFLKIEKPLLNVFEDKYGYEVDYYHATDNFDLNSTSYFKRAKENRNNGIIIKTPRGSLYVAFEPEQIKLADGTNTTFDGSNPDIRYAKGGLLAPNGKPSNLTPEQYKLVREPAFKKWFGDWENDPENSSKIVDYNGEPLVLYHGTNKKFNIFQPTEYKRNFGTIKSNAFFFAKDRIVAEYIAELKSDEESEKIILPVFLNIKNSLDFTDEDVVENILPKVLGILPDDDFLEDTDLGSLFFVIENKEYAEEIKKMGYDGVHLIEGHLMEQIEDLEGDIIQSYAVFESEQIKLADGSNTTFDSNNPDIRFDEGGEPQLNEEAQQYIDIISINPKLEKYQKYKVILKDKFGIDFDSIYKDQEYIDNANLNDIKKQGDFLDFDNWLNYAKIISKKRGFVRMDSYLTPSDKYKLTDEIWNETSKNLDFIIKKIPYTERGTGSGDIARAFGDTIYYTDHADFYYFLHELGHIYDFQNKLQGIIKNPAYSPTNYGTTNGGETFAENFAIYFINPMALKNWNEDVYNAMDSEINEKYKNEINRIMPKNKDIKFENGGDVIINPTEIECHTCHWHWKVKDGGNDLFICHKCNYDNSKFYKFEGLEGEKILDTISYAKGGRTIAQTPAPKKDQIKGSDKNKEGSSKDLKSAKKIELSDSTIEAIKNKVDKHNEKHPKKKITIDSAKAVVRRGMGAYSTSYRPTISGGKPNSRVAWGLARLNAFLYKIVNGKSKSGKYSQDNDLIEELGYKVEKYEIGGIFQGTSYDFNVYSTEFMGTGEGNQTFGWGLYFTDQKAIAERYAYTPNENSFYINGLSLKDSKQFTQEEKDIILNVWRELWQIGYSETSRDYLWEILNEIEQKSILLDIEDESVFDKETILEINKNAEIYNDLYDKLKNESLQIKSNVVSVTLFKGKNPNEYHLLEFNKPVSNLQINKIENQAKKEGILIDDEKELKWFRNKLQDGSMLYDWLRQRFSKDYHYIPKWADEKASLFLLRAGIDGIKYKSGTLSGMEDEEGYNYVIFNADDVTIEGKEKYDDGGEINKNMRNEIIDILSKNARYGTKIFDLQEVGFEVIQSCIESNTYFGNAIKQANENYIMIPVKYDDKLWAIDKKVEYVYYAKPNQNTKIRVEYKYDMQDYPTPVLFDSETMNNEEFHDVNDYEEINVREFDSEFLYRGINNNEMLSIIENGFIKSNASMNIGEQQENTTSFAQHISQASSYAVGFNAWFDEVTFAKPKYILKVKKEGVNYKPTIETDVENEVDVFGEIPIQQIESIYEIKLGECQMGMVEINVGYKNDFSEGSRFPMFKKVFVRKTDISTLINEIDSKNKIEKNNDMINSNPKDTITMDIPLLIRFAELMREDIKTDVALHEIIENLIDIKDKGVLTMSDYESIIGNVTGSEENTNTDAVEEEKMEEGGKVNSIKSKKGDIKVSLDENWYGDDSKVELVPVSELIKFREFDRKVKPKYNQDNSRDNINHLKFMFQKDGVKEPIIIEYSAQDNAVLVIEGNHRINSAIDLGMEYLPARVVLKKYSKFTPNQLKSTMKVSGVTADKSGYISSDLKPSQVGIEGTMPIYADGGIIEGRLHSECDAEEGCGRKFQVGEGGHIIEAERDEAVIVADAFKDEEEYTIKGTPSEVASALNVMGGGKNFDKGAIIIKNGSELEIPELKKQATDTDVDDIIEPSSIIINRRSMADKKKYEVTGTPKQIASAINSINGNGVVIENGAEIKEN